MAEWCPLFGAIDPAWPHRARAIVIEARRILGAKPGMKASRFNAGRLALARALFGAAPKWAAYWCDARAAAKVQRDASPGLAFTLETAPPGPGIDPQEARLSACVLAVHLAQQARLEGSAAALVAAEEALTEARAWGQRRSLGSASAGGRKGTPDKPEDHAKVIATALRMLDDGKPRRGLAGRVSRAEKGYTTRTVNRILTGSGI